MARVGSMVSRMRELIVILRLHAFKWRHVFFARLRFRLSVLRICIWALVYKPNGSPKILGHGLIKG